MRMKMMTMAGKAPSGGAVASAGDRCSLSSPPQITHPHHHYSLFAHRRPQFVSRKNPKTKRFTNLLTVAAKAGPPPPSLTSDDTAVSFVGEENVPLEGVIQFEKPNSFALINKWGRVALLAGGDVLALLIFSAFGRFSHGFSVFDTDTLRTADPFIAGWFLSAYFLGGFGEDGIGMNGPSKAVIAAAKSWSLGIPIGLVIRTTTVGHIPPPNFITVTMGSTALLLIGWRALLFSIFPNDDKSKKNEMYRRGGPFELFELLTSLVRRW